MLTAQMNINDLPEIDELYHHGVKGQQWGVQNGPPYPLDKPKKFDLIINKDGRLSSGRPIATESFSDFASEYEKQTLKSRSNEDNSKITKEWNRLVDKYMDNPSPKDYVEIEKSLSDFTDKLTLSEKLDFDYTIWQVKEYNLKNNWSNLKTFEEIKQALSDLDILYKNDSNDRYAAGTLMNWYDELTDRLANLEHSDHLEHHGILGQKWGDQNGPPYPLNPSQKSYSEKKQAKMDKKWIRKNDKKIRRYADSQSREELRAYEKELRRTTPKYNKNGKINSNYATAYSKKMAELYNKAIGDLAVGSGSGSGKVVKFVAARGQMDVFTALADYGYDMSNVRNGVYDSGRIGYRKESVGVDRDERR